MALASSDIAASLQAIHQHHRILIVPHANVDPDALSSALACYQMFSAIGKDVTVICPDTPPESLEFLPGFEKMGQEILESQNFIITVNLEEGVEIDKLRYTVEDKRVNIIVVPKRGKIHGSHISFSEGEKQYDLIVVVDTADLALLGNLYTDHVDLFSEVPILNIDHHISNQRYGQLQLIDPTAASATEVLYVWFMQVPEWREKMTADMATLLLTGLITDTRSFQNPNTTPRSLEIAAELLERGARQQEIVKHIYKTKPLSTLKIWGRALNRIQMDTQSGIVWSTISSEDLQEMAAKPAETHGILDELISTIPDADLYILFTETEGGFKASVRSSAVIDASRLVAELFGGGGHPRAAGFRIRTMENFQLQVLSCIQKLKEGMSRQRASTDHGPSPSVVAAPINETPPASLHQAPIAAPKVERHETDIVQAVSASDGKDQKALERDIVRDLTLGEEEKEKTQP